jgi:hypothetical protein
MTDDLLALYGECNPQYILNNPMMRERVLRRLNRLKHLFTQQFSAYKNIDLDMSLLRETVESCFCDIYRLKLFRGIHHEDEHKQAAFFMIWIAKLRPIQIIKNSNIQHSTDVLANELFAIYAGLSILNISPRFIFNSLPDYFVNLLYLLHFHSCSAEQLASEMSLLEKLVTELTRENNHI